jgi:transcriptional regulator with XRE-family HTH domain
MNKTGEKIKQLRIEKGFTLEALAKLVGTGKSYIWEIEKGNRNPSGLKLHQIAKHLDTTTEFLTDDTKDSMEKSSKEQVLLRKYRALNDKDKERIEKILDILMLNEG